MDLMSTAQLLGNFGEFAGAFAVFGTLVYLAVQVRHGKRALDANTRAIEESQRLTRAEMLYRLSQRHDENIYRATENSEIASIFVRGNNDPDSLDEAGREIFVARVSSYFNEHLMWHRMVGDGYLDPEYTEFVDQDLGQGWGRTPGARRVWEEELQQLFPHREHVNSILRRSD
jgi:hypothetical protein